MSGKLPPVTTSLWGFFLHPSKNTKDLKLSSYFQHPIEQHKSYTALESRLTSEKPDTELLNVFLMRSVSTPKADGSGGHFTETKSIDLARERLTVAKLLEAMKCCDGDSLENTQTCWKKLFPDSMK